MGETVTFRIGDTDVALGPLSIAALERAWPAIVDFPQADTTIAQGAYACEILAAALASTSPGFTADRLKEEMGFRDIGALLTGIAQLLAISGLEPEKATPAGGRTRKGMGPNGTATGSGSSPSS